MTYDVYDSPLGRILMASEDGQALCGLWFEGQKHFPATEGWSRVEGLPLYGIVRAWLNAYFAKRPRPALPPMKAKGTPFQQVVWEVLLDIPYGTSVSYGALARRVAGRLGRQSMSAQAVGGAVGRNPISILVPCHRVMGADGSLTGYAGGVERKLWLLEHERA